MEKLDIFEAQKLFERDELHKALEVLNILTDRNPSDIESLNLQGRIFFKMQKWGDAMNSYSLVLEFEPENQEAKSGLEMAKSILGYFTPDMFNP